MSDVLTFGTEEIAFGEDLLYFGPVDELTVQSIEAQAPIIGSPTLTQSAGGTHELTSQDILAGASVIGAPTITQDHALSALSIAVPAPVVSAPTADQVSALIAADIIAAAPFLKEPRLNWTIGDVPRRTAAALLESRTLTVD